MNMQVVKEAIETLCLQDKSIFVTLHQDPTQHKRLVELIKKLDESCKSYRDGALRPEAATSIIKKPPTKKASSKRKRPLPHGPIESCGPNPSKDGTPITGAGASTQPQSTSLPEHLAKLQQKIILKALEIRDKDAEFHSADCIGRDARIADLGVDHMVANPDILLKALSELSFAFEYLDYAKQECRTNHLFKMLKRKHPEAVKGGITKYVEQSFAGNWRVNRAITAGMKYWYLYVKCRIIDRPSIILPMILVLGSENYKVAYGDLVCLVTSIRKHLSQELTQYAQKDRLIDLVSEYSKTRHVSGQGSDVVQEYVAEVIKYIQQDPVPEPNGEQQLVWKESYHSHESQADGCIDQPQDTSFFDIHQTSQALDNLYEPRGMSYFDGYQPSQAPDILYEPQGMSYFDGCQPSQALDILYEPRGMSYFDGCQPSQALDNPYEPQGTSLFENHEPQQTIDEPYISQGMRYVENHMASEIPNCNFSATAPFQQGSCQTIDMNPAVQSIHHSFYEGTTSGDSLHNTDNNHLMDICSQRGAQSSFIQLYPVDAAITT